MLCMITCILATNLCVRKILLEYQLNAWTAQLLLSATSFELYLPDIFLIFLFQSVYVRAQSAMCLQNMFQNRSPILSWFILAILSWFKCDQVLNEEQEERKDCQSFQPVSILTNTSYHIWLVKLAETLISVPCSLFPSRQVVRWSHLRANSNMTINHEKRAWRKSVFYKSPEKGAENCSVWMRRTFRCTVDKNDKRPYLKHFL